MYTFLYAKWSFTFYRQQMQFMRASPQSRMHRLVTIADRVHLLIVSIGEVAQRVVYVSI